MKKLIQWFKSLFGSKPEPVKSKPKRKPKKEPAINYSKMTKAQLQEHAAKRGLKVSKGMKKQDLVDLVQHH